ncbi:MAG: D-alanine--D-alanine ligase [Deltaproteobacteria bacterium]|nr:D-alanine--D-alanine ligase [Deltaproteobacteria bacterium]
MKIVVLHEVVPPEAPPDEQDVLVEVEMICTALRELGHEPYTVALGLDLDRTLREIQAHSPEIVFNMVETVCGDGGLIHLAPSLLDHMGMRYTGSPLDAIYVTTNKVLTKKLLEHAGIATPPWVTLEQASQGQVPFEGPYIIKPVWEDASIGLNDDSIARDRVRLSEVIPAHRARIRGELFVEGFVDGREFNLSVLEIDGAPVVLPPAEIRFIEFPEGKPRFVGYRAKWDEDSFEFRNTPRSFEFPPEDAPLLSQLSHIALECWNLLGLRGYGRVDFRVDASGRPWVLEVNVNPCLSPDAGFMAACDRAGISAADAVRRILSAARN